MSLSLFPLDHLLLGIQLTFKSSLFPLWDWLAWTKLNFPLQVVIKDDLLVRYWICVHFFSALGCHLVESCEGSVHAVSVSVSSCVSTFCELEDLGSLVSSNFCVSDCMPNSVCHWVRSSWAIGCVHASMHNCNGSEGKPHLTSWPPVTHQLLAIDRIF